MTTSHRPLNLFFRMHNLRKKDRSKENIVSLVRKNCSQLFCLFTGLAGSLAVPPVDFLKSAGLFNRNIMMFRDPFIDDYRRGVGGVVTDLPALVEWQKQQYHQLPHVRETYCIGESMGALAAMRFGYHIRATTVWAFAPRPFNWFRAPRALSELVRLLSTSNGITEYRIYYSTKTPLDRLVAKAFTACPGVVCCPCEKTPVGLAGHVLIPILIQEGVLTQLFPPFAPSNQEAGKE